MSNMCKCGHDKADHREVAFGLRPCGKCDCGDFVLDERPAPEPSDEDTCNCGHIRRAHGWAFEGHCSVDDCICPRFFGVDKPTSKVAPTLEEIEAWLDDDPDYEENDDDPMCDWIFTAQQHIKTLLRKAKRQQQRINTVAEVVGEYCEGRPALYDRMTEALQKELEAQRKEANNDT